MIERRKLVYGAIAFLGMIAILTVTLFFVNPRESIQDSKVMQDSEEIILRDSEGLNIEYPEGFENGETVTNGERDIFERYILIDNTGQYKNIVSSGYIDISKNNAKVFLTPPNGVRTEITSDLSYFPFRILPPPPEGTYTLTFNLNTGETFERKIEDIKFKEVELMSTGLKKVQKKPVVEFGTPPTTEQGILLNDFGIWDRKNRELSAFSLGNLDLTKATSLYYIDPHSTVKSINTPLFDVDQYFWLDLFKISEIQHGEHIFMARIDNVWYYAMANYPEDFE